MSFAKFDAKRCAPLNLTVIDFRVPLHNDLYIAKNGLLVRFKGENHSRRAQKRIIVVESFDKSLGELR